VLKPGTQRPSSSPVAMATAIQTGNSRSSAESLLTAMVSFTESQLAMGNKVSPLRCRRCRLR
jgi:hypothetical protein